MVPFISKDARVALIGPNFLDLLDCSLISLLPGFPSVGKSTLLSKTTHTGNFKGVTDIGSLTHPRATQRPRQRPTNSRP
jgi:hypothetical protein